MSDGGRPGPTGLVAGDAQAPGFAYPEGDLVEAELKLLLFILDVYTIFVRNQEITGKAQNNKHN